MPRIFLVNVGWVWDEYDGRTEVLPWYSNLSMQGWSVWSSDKIHKGASEEDQARWLQDHEHSYESNLQLKQRGKHHQDLSEVV